jgi:hypothetical protein
LRALRIAAPVQLGLDLSDVPPSPQERWPALPEKRRAEVLALLARLIARGIVKEAAGD